MRKTHHFLAGVLLLGSLFAPAAGAQQPSKEVEASRRDFVFHLLGEGWREIEQFQKAGGRPGDPKHPAPRWASALWKYHDAHSESPGAPIAVTAAMGMLSAAERWDEMFSRAETLAPDDPAWEEILRLLMDADTQHRDRPFGRKAESLLTQMTNKRLRASVHLTVGQMSLQQKSAGKARASFHAAIAEAPETPPAQKARGWLYELDHLQEGAPAPVFTARTLDGATVTSTELRGKVVLLDFWASWCHPCIEDFPALKRLHDRFAKHGLVILGISVDENPESAQKSAVSRQIPWAQICDGRVFDGEVARTFNVQIIPAFYLIGRDGRIASKSTGGGSTDALARAVRQALGR